MRVVLGLFGFGLGVVLSSLYPIPTACYYPGNLTPTDIHTHPNPHSLATDLGNGLVNPAAVNEEDSLSPTLAQLQAAAVAATLQARDHGASPPPMPPRPYDTMEIATVKGLFSEAGPSEVFVLPPEEEEAADEEGQPRSHRNRVSTEEEEALRRSLATPQRPPHRSASWLAKGDGSATPSRLSSSLRRLAGSLLGGGKQLEQAQAGEGPAGMSSSLRQRRPSRGPPPARMASL